MGNYIKIKCRDTYKSGNSYSDDAKEIEVLIREMKEICENIKTYWNGVDYDNFAASFHEYLNDLNITVRELKRNGNLLKNISGGHGKIDNDLLSDMKGRVYDER